MTRTTLLLRTLLWHWQTNLAVLLGVVTGTAVIAGALIVGDSVRGSLRDMTLVRLGKIDHVLRSPRFVREQLAGDLAALPEFQSRFAACVPAIILPAALEKNGANGTTVLARAGGVEVYALDSRGWDLLDHGSVPAPDENQLLLSAGLARQLGAVPGDNVLLSVELPSDVPRDALLGERDETAVQVPLVVGGILDEASGAGRLGLAPNQQLPRNAFVSLATLQDRLGLHEHRASRRSSQMLPARVNALLVSARSPPDGSGSAASEAAYDLTILLSKVWTLPDLHLRVVAQPKFGYIALESERMILEPAAVEAARDITRSAGNKTSPVLAYIANEISVVRPGDSPDRGEPPRYSRYSVVAGLQSATFIDLTAAPFGPFEFVDGPPQSPLGDGEIDRPDGTGEILLNDWLAADLQARVGDVVRLTYHIVGSHGELPEVERRFAVRGIVKLDGTVAADRGLIPEVRGITDVNSFREWNAPFPTTKAVTRRDDDYWDRYRATPKAFVTLPAAQHLWASRYGDLTSYRVAPLAGQSLEAFQNRFARELLGQLQPARLGLSFQPVKYLGLQAASGTTDFGGLFIGFSLFLILSAAILVGLLFRLGIERRAAHVGILLASGFSQPQVRRLLFSEALIVIAAGALLGILAAIAYAALMIHGLTTWWIGAIGTRFLTVHIVPASLATGAAIAVCVALLAVWWGVRGLWKVSPRGLLAGTTGSAVTAHNRARRRRRSTRIAQGLALFSLAMIILFGVGLVPAGEAFEGLNWSAVIFFLVGMAMLTAGLMALAAWLDGERAAAVRGSGARGLARLGARNAERHRTRSLLSTGLIACATFLIVAIAAGHRNPVGEQPDRNSGNGGFTLVAESAVPVVYDLNTAAGRRAQFGLEAEGQENNAAGGDLAKLRAIHQVVAFPVNPGENASCLNIYQTTQPTILGVPPEMVERGGFRFVGAGAGNPWNLLREGSAGEPIPVFGDMNTLQYSLHVGPGAILEIRDEFQQPIKVRIAGMLDSSVFQGVLLMDETPFRRLFPSRAGARYFLIDVPPRDAQAVSDVLESRLPGFDAERVVDRLANFLAVQNTYLSTFQALGGLGLLLGTIGLATVMLRNILERRPELALLRAVGFRDSGLTWLILCENGLLLLWGLAVGTVSALIAMLPHLLSTGADISWPGVGGLLLAVFCVGMLAALAAVRSALVTPVVATLRGE